MQPQVNDTSLGEFLFSFRVINLNNAGDSAVEKERDGWIEVHLMQFIFNFNTKYWVVQGHFYTHLKLIGKTDKCT